MIISKDTSKQEFSDIEKILSKITDLQMENLSNGLTIDRLIQVLHDLLKN